MFRFPDQQYEEKVTLKASNVIEEEPFESLDEEDSIPEPPKEPDSESNTTFYSVQSDLEDDSQKNRVKFGSSVSIDKIHVDDVLNAPIENMSPIKKLKRLLSSAGSDKRNSRVAEYDVQTGQEFHTAYVDLPKISVNPLFVDQEMVEDLNDSQEEFFEVLPKSTVITRYLVIKAFT